MRNAERWTVYGVGFRGPHLISSIAREFRYRHEGASMEEQAYAHLMSCLVTFGRISAVIVHTHPTRKPTHLVALRVGGGKAWFE